jgi:excisionase family DNA binding protein
MSDLTRTQTLAEQPQELTPGEVAREFKVSPSTVRRWGKRGWLPPTRLLPGSRYRRYSREAVDEFRRRYEAGEFDERPSGNASASIDK